MSQVWAKEFDPGSKAYYYYNVETYETTWDKPPDFVDGDEASLSVGDGLKMLKACKMIQRNYRAKKARGALRAKRSEKLIAAHGGNTGGCNWVETIDPHSQQPYYYHVSTHETVWDAPEEWKQWDRKQNPEKYAAEEKAKAKMERAKKREQQAKLEAFKAKKAAGQGKMQLGGLGGLGGGGFGALGGATEIGAGKTQQSLASAFGGKSKEGEDDEKTPFMLDRRKKADAAAKAAAEKAEKAAAKFDGISSRIVDKCTEKCPKKCCYPCHRPWPYEGRPIKDKKNPGAETMDDSFDLCGFWKEVDLMIASFGFPCVAYGCNERWIDERNDMGFLCCLCYSCSCIFCPVVGPVGMLTWERAKFRELSGQSPEPWIVDCCASFFCHCCTLSQIGRGLRNLGYDGTEDVIGGPPTSVDMLR